MPYSVFGRGRNIDEFEPRKFWNIDENFDGAKLLTTLKMSRAIVCFRVSSKLFHTN
jgi:hypothetical protein